MSELPRNHVSHACNRYKETPSGRPEGGPSIGDTVFDPVRRNLLRVNTICWDAEINGLVLDCDMFDEGEFFNDYFAEAVDIDPNDVYVVTRGHGSAAGCFDENGDPVGDDWLTRARYRLDIIYGDMEINGFLTIGTLGGWHDEPDEAAVLEVLNVPVVVGIEGDLCTVDLVNEDGDIINDWRITKESAEVIFGKSWAELHAQAVKQSDSEPVFDDSDRAEG
ncbi:MAG: hypothetical protein EKK55_22665 [Rhodocyclaceae bacterium]|nr:MAG: hypothetical protein EKK55_22665 [Rhodocyclaceae bacterium]